VLGVGELAQPAVQELLQAGSEDRVAGPGPHLVLAAERPPVERVAAQLAQEQDVARGDLPEGVRAVPFHLTPESGFEQRRDVVPGQRLQLEVLAAAAVAERVDGPRRWLGEPHGQQHAAARRVGEVVHEPRGRFVQEMGVVHADHQRPALRPAGDRVLQGRERRGLLGRSELGGVVAQEGGGGTEGDGRGGAGGEEADDLRALPGQVGQDLVGEAGLADP
jgi:hypothetical protein